MRICMLLHGHIRTFEQTITSFKKYVENFDKIDIFIHTWTTIDRKTNSWYKKNDTNILVDKNKIIQIYNPKALLIEENISNEPSILCPGNKISLDGHRNYFESFIKLINLKIYMKKNITLNMIL